MLNKSQKLVFFLLIVFFSGTLSLYQNNTFLLISMIVTLFIFYQNSARLDYRFLGFLVAYFFIITVISDLFFPSKAETIVIFGTLVRIIFSTFAAALLGFKLFDYYYNFIYKMALISLPLFFLQIYDSTIFTKSLRPLAKLITPDFRFEVGKYCYLVHNFHIDSPIRNSGFMWEPGSFGMAIGLALFYGLSNNRFQWNRRLFILLAVGLTTLSTTFYFSLAIIFIYYFANKYKDNTKKVVVLSMSIVLFSFLFNSLPFMEEKVEFHLERYDHFTRGGNLNRMTEIGGEAGRIISFAADIKSFLRFPFGHGDNESYRTTNAKGELITGANGLGPFMVRYGFMGLIFLMLSLNKTSRVFQVKFQSRLPQLFTLLVLLYLFSNPIYRNPFFLTLLFLPFANKSSAGTFETFNQLGDKP